MRQPHANHLCSGVGAPPLAHPPRLPLCHRQDAEGVLAPQRPAAPHLQRGAAAPAPDAGSGQLQAEAPSADQLPSRQQRRQRRGQQQPQNCAARRWRRQAGGPARLWLVPCLCLIGPRQAHVHSLIAFWYVELMGLAKTIPLLQKSTLAGNYEGARLAGGCCCCRGGAHVLRRGLRALLQLPCCQPATAIAAHKRSAKHNGAAAAGGRQHAGGGLVGHEVAAGGAAGQVGRGG